MLQQVSTAPSLYHNTQLTKGLDNTLALGSNGPENWLICDLDSNIVHLSAMVSSHLQYPERDLLGRTVPDLVHRE